MARSRNGRTRAPLTEAVEPRSYDRRFYARALIAGALLIAVSAALLSFYGWRTKAVNPGPSFDLTNLFIQRMAVVPDPANPCIVLQEHLEATRTRNYDKAYSDLCEGLKKEVSFAEFSANALSDNLLFGAVSGYRFPTFTVTGTAASATGYIEYFPEGHSRVEAAFAKEGTSWRIAQLKVIYQ
jgi:hypothetical protein